jgi:hypothetical protein
MLWVYKSEFNAEHDELDSKPVKIKCHWRYKLKRYQVMTALAVYLAV